MFMSLQFYCNSCLQSINHSSFGSIVKFNEYTKRLRKQSLLHNVSEFAEHLFQNWHHDRDDYDQSSSRGGSWFRPNFGDDGFRRGKMRNRRSRTWRREFEFCDGDEEIEFENIFQSAFGGNRSFYWSFTMDDEPRFRNWSGYSNNYRSFGQRRHQSDEEYDSSSECEEPAAGVTSDRLALGLSASGPLNLEDVKNAYRASALKWHPDRHQGSAKVFRCCFVVFTLAYVASVV
ncbi:heat shock protein binding protein [Dorcoceras hygrometricum]|uniref:Heat shock protein binding protein n=1 Tax=Dorcoceras hygrometricum TaxID=472368 RepID=A0A2Z7BQ73_9LAMI|nr:heat shock protein binding protein [Dorcoceras hygrometricum]